jgi:hypothetical protein
MLTRGSRVATRTTGIGCDASASRDTGLLAGSQVIALAVVSETVVVSKQKLGML